jgi:hypothetical protein
VAEDVQRVDLAAQFEPSAQLVGVDDQHGVPLGLDEPRRGDEPAVGDSAYGTGGLRDAM